MRDISEWSRLATYNAEVSRGVVHTDAYDAFMAAEQARFDAAQIAKYPDREAILNEDGRIIGWIVRTPA